MKYFKRMISLTTKRRIEILKIKRLSFAIVFKDHEIKKTNRDPILSKHPGFSYQKDMIWGVHRLYHEILELKSLSLEEVYTTLGVDLEPTDSIKCIHRRKHTREFREEIAKIITMSIQQIEKNADRVDMCKITHKIFHGMQAFTADKPYYIASQWFLGNSNDRNDMMKAAFEAYSLAPNNKKNDPDFCVKVLVHLLHCIQDQVLSSFRTMYLDHILDHIYQWYFIHSETSYDFLIFMPDAFDDVRDFLLDVLDTNPFGYYLKKEGDTIERISNEECCLNADNFLYLSMDVVNKLPSARELTKKFDAFFQTYADFNEHGIFDCKCYNVTDQIPLTMPKTQDGQQELICTIENLIRNNNIRPVIAYKSIIAPKQDFIQKIIKRDLLSKIPTHTDQGCRESEQLNLFNATKKQA